MKRFFLSIFTLLATIGLIACGGGGAAAPKSGLGIATPSSCQCSVKSDFVAAQNQTLHRLTWQKGSDIEIVLSYFAEGKPEDMGARKSDIMFFLRFTHAGPEFKSGKGKGLNLTLWANAESLETMAPWASGNKKDGKVIETYQLIIPEAFETELRRAGWIKFELKGSEPWTPPNQYIEVALEFFEKMGDKR